MSPTPNPMPTEDPDLEGAPDLDEEADPAEPHPDEPRPDTPIDEVRGVETPDKLSSVGEPRADEPRIEPPHPAAESAEEDAGEGESSDGGDAA